MLVSLNLYVSGNVKINAIKHDYFEIDGTADCIGITLTTRLRIFNDKISLLVIPKPGVPLCVKKALIGHAHCLKKMQVTGGYKCEIAIHQVPENDWLLHLDLLLPRIAQRKLNLQVMTLVPKVDFSKRYKSVLYVNKPQVIVIGDLAFELSLSDQFQLILAQRNQVATIRCLALRIIIQLNGRIDMVECSLLVSGPLSVTLMDTVDPQCHDTVSVNCDMTISSTAAH